MAGFSGTPLVQKLGIKAGHRLALLRAPEGLDTLLAQLPEDVTPRTTLAGRAPFDVVLCFATSLGGLKRVFHRLVSRLASNGGLWICWPKRSSGVATDLAENVIRAEGLALGVVDNKVCAIDETWSGLRFVFRLRHRE